MKNDFGDKSYVSMETKICPICGEECETGNILFNKRLSNTLGSKTATGWGVCPTHVKMLADGYVAVIAAKPDGDETHMTSWDQHSGKYMMLRENLFTLIFDIPAPPTRIAAMSVPEYDKLAAYLEKKMGEGHEKANLPEQGAPPQA